MFFRLFFFPLACGVFRHRLDCLPFSLYLFPPPQRGLSELSRPLSLWPSFSPHRFFGSSWFITRDGCFVLRMLAHPPHLGVPRSDSFFFQDSYLGFLLGSFAALFEQHAIFVNPGSVLRVSGPFSPRFCFSAPQFGFVFFFSSGDDSGNLQYFIHIFSTVASINSCSLFQLRPPAQLRHRNPSLFPLVSSLLLESFNMPVTFTSTPDLSFHF